MSETQPERGDGGAYPSDYDSQRTPPREGEPPRPANEPSGSEGSSDNGKTLTDPATGAPNPD